jgi:integrase
MFYRWLEDTHEFEGKNPAARFAGYREAVRERFLTVEEMGRLGNALRLAETVGLPPAPIHAKKPSKKRKRNSGMFTSQLVPANPVAVSVIRFLALSGWRKNEALNLRWREVNLATGVVMLVDTKTGKSIRTLGGAALAIIAAQPRIEGSDYVFPGRDPKRPLRELQRLWYATRHAAKLTDVRLHDLRHSVASVAGGHGYSLPLIGKLLGHKTTRSTERYSHHYPDASKVVADTVSEAISAALSGNTTPIIPLRMAR